MLPVVVVVAVAQQKQWQQQWRQQQWRLLLLLLPTTVVGALATCQSAPRISFLAPPFAPFGMRQRQRLDGLLALQPPDLHSWALLLLLHALLPTPHS